MAEVALSAALIVAALVSFRQLSAFHPATLWLASWALASTLLAFGALPYRPLSATAIAIIVGWTALFCLGTLVGARIRVPSVARRPRLPPDESGRRLSYGAALAALVATAGLALFLAQVASLHGLRAAIVSDSLVRLDISQGATPYTIKYIYVAFAAAALAGLAAGRAQSDAARRTWIMVALAMICAQYFSTGRSNILLAAVMAFVAFSLSGPRTIARGRLILVSAGVVASLLVMFLGMGSLLGKSFETSELRTFDNVFVRHQALQPLALPYQYLTAPLPSFDALRSVTPTGGRGGCRTLSPACSVGEKLGLPVQPEPTLTGYTRPPMRWNTFTALYGPLVDAGVLLGSVLILGQGMIFGLLWGLARTGSVYAVGAYAAMSAAPAYSTVENTLLQPHFIGAALFAVALIVIAALLESLVSAAQRRTLAN